MAKCRKKATELERHAYHEAGHAVMAYILKRRFHFITIDPEKLDKNTGGLVQLAHSQKLQKSLNGGGFDDNRPILEKQIKITLAAEVACGLLVGRIDWKIAEKDIQDCLSLTGSLCGDDEETYAYLNWLLLSVRNELQLPYNWARVYAVAQALMQQKTLSYHKAREIIQNAKE
jgi:ATP-dependent Zn protease